MAWCQTRGRFQQPRHLGRREDVWLGPLVVGRESRWIREETFWLGAPPVSAEVIDVEHADTTHTRTQVLLRSAPTLKSRRSQVRVRAGLLMKKAIQRLQCPSRRRKTAPQDRFSVTYRFRVGARVEENDGVAVMDAPPLPLCLCLGRRAGLHAGRRWLSADTSTCFPLYDARECLRWFLSGVPLLSR